MRKRRATLLVDAGIWLRLAGDEGGARNLFEQALALDPDNRQAAQLLTATSGGAEAATPKTAPGEAPHASAPVVARKPPVRGPPKPDAQRATRPPEPPARVEPAVRTMAAPTSRLVRAEAPRVVVAHSPASSDRDEPRATPEEGEFRGFDSAAVLERQVPENATILTTHGELPQAGNPAPQDLHSTQPAPRRPTKPPVPEEASSPTIVSKPTEASMRLASSEPSADAGPTFRPESVILPLPAGEPPAFVSRQDAVIEYLRETDAYLRYGIYEKALEYAAKVLAEDPENDEAYGKAKVALVASKGNEDAFEHLLKVIRLYAARLDAERAGPFLDELMAQRPGHPELPVLLSVLRPYELELSGWSEEGPLLDRALVAYIETMKPELSGDAADTLPPDSTIPAEFQLPAPFRLARPAAADGTEGTRIIEAPAQAGSPAKKPEVPKSREPASDETVFMEPGGPKPPQVQPKPLYADDEAEAPQPPFRRPKRRR